MSNFAAKLREMGKLVINSYDEFAAHLGEELGASDWLQVDQDRINLFADATLDHQWIHVDVERAKTESQYQSTIAHGYLTLSLLPYMWDQIIEVHNIKMLVNYGMDKMRFGQPVITGSKVRLVTKLRGTTQACTRRHRIVPLLFYIIRYGRILWNHQHEELCERPVLRHRL